MENNAPRYLAWLAVLGLMLGLTAFFHAISGRDGGIVEQWNEDGHAQVMLERDRSGHFLAQGEINGHPVLFLVDTGATDVAISEKAAREMGLEFGPRTTVMTAAGPARAWRTRLDRVSLGTVALDNVRATITPGLGNEVLLGMSFLKYFHMRQDGNQMVLESRNQTE